LGGYRHLQRPGCDARAACHRYPDDLAGSQIIIQAAFVDSRSVSAVMTRSIGMGSEMDRGMQRGQRYVRASFHVAKHFPQRRGISRPDLESFGNGGRDIVNHDSAQVLIRQESWSAHSVSSLLTALRATGSNPLEQWTMSRFALL